MIPSPSRRYSAEEIRNVLGVYNCDPTELYRDAIPEILTQAAEDAVRLEQIADRLRLILERDQDGSRDTTLEELVDCVEIDLRELRDRGYAFLEALQTDRPELTCATCKHQGENLMQWFSCGNVRSPLYQQPFRKPALAVIGCTFHELKTVPLSPALSPRGAMTMLTDAQKTCAHCWHLVADLVDDDRQRTGTDHRMCCHCGFSELRDWTLERDPMHGPHALPGTEMRVYTVRVRSQLPPPKPEPPKLRTFTEGLFGRKWIG